MTLFLAPDDGPFVFGAFAAHLDQNAPVRPSGPLGSTAEADDLAPTIDESLQGVVTPVTAERGLPS